MTHADQHDNLPTWLALDDNRYVLNGVLFVAATSLALALSSCLRRTSKHSKHSTVERHLQERPSSLLTAALSSLHLLQSQPSDSHMPSTIDTPSPNDAEQKERKSTRSKERRRRGKDPLKDLFKGGKTSKALLKSVTTSGSDHALTSSTSSLGAPRNSNTLGIDSSTSTSRSVSPDASREPSNHSIPRMLNPSSDDGNVRNTATSSANTPIPSFGEASDHSSSSHNSRSDDVPHRAPVASIGTNSAPTIALPASDSSLSSRATSTELTDPRASPSRDSQAESSSGSSFSKPIRVRPKLRTSRNDSSVHLPPSLSAPDKVPSDASIPSPSFPSAVSCPAVSTTSSTCVPFTPLVYSQNDTMMDHSNQSLDGVGPPTPTNPSGPTPSPCRSLEESSSPSQVPGQVPVCSQDAGLDNTAVSVQTQLASMRGALEAARLREEELRAKAEQANKERDELCWRWNEDAGAWRRREAELQAHIHYLMQQVQAYAAVASFQAQQAQNRPSSGISSPTSPHPRSSPHLPHHPLLPYPPAPLIQAQNSASAPAHVQALLASAPMLTTHYPGFGMGIGAASNGGIYPGSPAGVGMSPLLWSGLGGQNHDTRNEGHQTPDSCTSGSSSRGRRRRRRAEDVKSASDDSSLGDWDGMSNEDGSLGVGVAVDGDGSGGDRWYRYGYGDGDGYEGEEGDEEWEEDIFRKNMLADAILKRPESIQGLSWLGKRPTNAGRVSSRASVRSEGAVSAPMVTRFVNGHGNGNIGHDESVRGGVSGGGSWVVDSLAPDMDRETVLGADTGSAPPISPADTVTRVKASPDDHDRQ